MIGQFKLNTWVHHRLLVGCLPSLNTWVHPRLLVGCLPSLNTWVPPVTSGLLTLPEHLSSSPVTSGLLTLPEHLSSSPVISGLLTLPEHLSSSPVISGVRVTRSLVLCVCFVDHCLSFCTFSVGFMLSVLLRYTDYPFGIFKLFLYKYKFHKYQRTVFLWHTCLRYMLIICHWTLNNQHYDTMLYCWS